MPAVEQRGTMPRTLRAPRRCGATRGCSPALAVFFYCRLHGLDVRPRRAAAEPMSDSPDRHLAVEGRRPRRGDVRVRLRAGAALRRVLRRHGVRRQDGDGGRRRRRASPMPSRTVRVEFLASVARGAPFTLEPEVSHLEVHPGQLYETHFRARNLTGSTLVGAGRAERRAGRRGALFQQGRVLLLHEPGVRAARGADAEALVHGREELPAHVDTLSLSYTYFSASN